MWRGQRGNYRSWKKIALGIIWLRVCVPLEFAPKVEEEKNVGEG